MDRPTLLKSGDGPNSGENDGDQIDMTPSNETQQELAGATGAGAAMAAAGGASPRVAPEALQKADSFERQTMNADSPADFVSSYINRGSDLMGGNVVSGPTGRSATANQTIRALRGQEGYNKPHYESFASGPRGALNILGQETAVGEGGVDNIPKPQFFESLNPFAESREFKRPIRKVHAGEGVPSYLDNQLQQVADENNLNLDNRPESEEAVRKTLQKDDPIINNFNRKVQDYWGDAPEAYKDELFDRARDYETSRRAVTRTGLGVGALGAAAYGASKAQEGEMPSLDQITKTSGGPGSGKSRDSTDEIKRLEKSPLVTLHRRHKIMEHRGADQTKELDLSEIDYGAQETYDIEKMGWFLSNVGEWVGDPIDVVRIDGEHHLMDGHHRFLASDRLGMDSIEANVYIMDENEVRRVTGQEKGGAVMAGGKKEAAGRGDDLASVSAESLSPSNPTHVQRTYAVHDKSYTDEADLQETAEEGFRDEYGGAPSNTDTAPLPGGGMSGVASARRSLESMPEDRQKSLISEWKKDRRGHTGGGVGMGAGMALGGLAGATMRRPNATVVLTGLGGIGGGFLGKRIGRETAPAPSEVQPNQFLQKHSSAKESRRRLSQLGQEKVAAGGLLGRLARQAGDAAEDTASAASSGGDGLFSGVDEIQGRIDDLSLEDVRQGAGDGVDDVGSAASSADRGTPDELDLGDAVDARGGSGSSGAPSGGRERAPDELSIEDVVGDTPPSGAADSAPTSSGGRARAEDELTIDDVVGDTPPGGASAPDADSASSGGSGGASGGSGSSASDGWNWSTLGGLAGGTAAAGAAARWAMGGAGDAAQSAAKNTDELNLGDAVDGIGPSGGPDVDDGLNLGDAAEGLETQGRDGFLGGGVGTDLGALGVVGGGAALGAGAMGDEPKQASVEKEGLFGLRSGRVPIPADRVFQLGKWLTDKGIMSSSRSAVKANPSLAPLDLPARKPTGAREGYGSMSDAGKEIDAPEPVEEAYTPMAPPRVGQEKTSSRSVRPIIGNDVATDASRPKEGDEVYSSVNDEMLRIVDVEDNMYTVSDGSSEWKEPRSVVRHKMRRGFWDRDRGQEKQASPMAMIGSGAAGGATGAGLSYMKQRGEMYSGKQERVNPYRLAQAGVIGGGLGIAGPPAVRKGRQLGRQGERVMDETEAASKAMREAADDLGGIRQTIDAGADDASDLMGRIDDVADQVEDTNRSAQSVLEKADNNRFFGIFSKESSLRKAANVKSNIGDAFVDFVQRADAPSPQKFEEHLRGTDGVPNPTVRSRPEKIDGPQMDEEDVVFSGGGGGPEVWEVQTDEGRHLIPGVDKGGEQLQIPDGLSGMADAESTSNVSQVSPTDLSKAESTGPTDTEFRLPRTEQSKMDEASNAYLGAAAVGGAGYGGYKLWEQSQGSSGGSGRRPEPKHRKSAGKMSTINMDLGTGSSKMFDGGFDFDMDMPEPKMPGEADVSMPDVGSTPDVKTEAPSVGDTDMDMAEMA